MQAPDDPDVGVVELDLGDGVGHVGREAGQERLAHHGPRLHPTRAPHRLEPEPTFRVVAVTAHHHRRMRSPTARLAVLDGQNVLGRR
jgi:hypothetical protein